MSEATVGEFKDKRQELMIERIVVIVNKKWEAAPILGVFSAPYSATTHASSRPVCWSDGNPYPQPKTQPDPDDPKQISF